MSPPKADVGSAKGASGKTDTGMSYPTAPVLVNIVFLSAKAVGVACHLIAFRVQCHPDRPSRETQRAECNSMPSDFQFNSRGHAAG